MKSQFEEHLVCSIVISKNKVVRAMLVTAMAIYKSVKPIHVVKCAKAALEKTAEALCAFEAK